MKLPIDGNPSAASLPLMAALVETNKELILIDTGFPGSTDLLDQLALLQFDLQDVTSIINTHTHTDHIGGNHLFPTARIIASVIDYNYQRDYSYALINTQNPTEVVSRFFPHSNSQNIEAAALHSQMLAKKYWRDDLLGPLDRIDWLEDKCALPEKIEIIKTPGHTPGHVAVVVRGDSQSFTAAGDAMPSRLFWKRRLHEITPRFSSAQFLRSKSKIENLHGIIMGGHDLPFQTSDLKYINRDRIVL